MLTTGAVPGRRERKKAATRLALSNAALQLFLARGFDDVTLREIADVVDVSTTTLMKHFPTKEALVFDRDEEIERSLVAAVVDRPAKLSVLDALRRYARTRVVRAAAGPSTKAFTKLVAATPALSNYWRTMWMRHEHVLARVLARELGRRAGDAWCAAMAHFVLETVALSERSSNPPRAVDVAFDILEHGWQRSRRA